MNKRQKTSLPSWSVPFRGGAETDDETNTYVSCQMVMPALEPYHSMCGLGACCMSTTQTLLERQNLRPHPNSQNQNRTFEQDSQAISMHIQV